MKHLIVPSLLVVGFLAAQLVYSQGAGAAYTGNSYTPNAYSARTPASSQNPALDREMAQEVISLSGSAELKIQPEKLRLVFGVLQEEKTAKLCSEKIKTVCDAIVVELTELGIQGEEVNQDFISVTPIFTWKEDQLGSQQVVRQEKSGYRMQSNLHVLCRDEEAAMKVIDIAFANGISDIIAFDYWSSGIDEAKKTARQTALKAASAKAESLFSVFKYGVQPINIQESTTVHKPSSLYRTFSRSNSESITFSRSWRDRAQIRVPRPELTYLENLPGENDVQAKSPAMRPEISVRSVVTVYYRSPDQQPEPRVGPALKR